MEIVDCGFPSKVAISSGGGYAGIRDLVSFQVHFADTSVLKRISVFFSNVNNDNII